MAATRPFLLERYFGRYEHSVAHQLSASDCEPLTVGGLLALAGADPDELLRLRLGYTETRGAAALRAAIAAFYPGCRSDDVLVAGAPQEAILLLLQAVLAAGDEVVVLTPCYQSLKDLPARSGATVLEWRLQPTATGFALDWPALAALLQRQPRLLITNFPHNPTGLLPTLDEWLHLQRLVARSGALWFSDEMYRGLAPDDASELPPAAVLLPQAISLWGLSKSFGLPGLRLGWLVARDRALLGQIEQQKDWTSICSNGVSELLAQYALAAAPAILRQNRERIAGNGARMHAFAAQQGARLRWQPPQGGPVSLAELPGGNATALAERVRERGSALLVPSPLFDLDDRWLRIGLGRADFAAALARWSAALG